MNKDTPIEQVAGNYQDHDNGSVVVNDPVASEQVVETANEIAIDHATGGHDPAPIGITE